MTIPYDRQNNNGKWTIRDMQPQEGRLAVVTGANSGLGFHTSKALALKGARVIMAGRSKIPAAGDKVKRLSGSEKVEMRYLDLSKIGSIHSLVQSLVDEGVKIDICILNAATALPGSRKTESGQDEMFLVNYLSNVVLTRLLLKRSVIPMKGASPLSRMIFISSDSHQGASYIDYNEFGRYFEYGVSKGISNYRKRHDIEIKISFIGKKTSYCKYLLGFTPLH